MKKIIKISIIALLSLTSVAGCSSASKPETPIKEYLKNARKMDLSKIKQHINPDSKESLEVLEKFEVASQEQKPLFDYLKKSAKKIEYTIEAIQTTEEDEAIATVAVVYNDAFPTIQEGLSQLLSEVFQKKVNDGNIEIKEGESVTLDPLTNEEIAQNSQRVAQIFKEIDSRQPDPKLITNTLTIPLIKIDNTWYLKELDFSILNILFSNVAEKILNP